MTKAEANKKRYDRLKAAGICIQCGFREAAVLSKKTSRDLCDMRQKSSTSRASKVPGMRCQKKQGVRSKNIIDFARTFASVKDEAKEPHPSRLTACHLPQGGRLCLKEVTA